MHVTALTVDHVSEMKSNIMKQKVKIKRHYEIRTDFEKGYF